MAADPHHEFFKAQVNQLIKLIPRLPKSVPLATYSDRIQVVFKNIPLVSDDAWPVFNRRFDALFGEDTRDKDGRLLNIRSGPLGMDAVVIYLQAVICLPLLWEAARPKIERLVTEITYLM